MSSGDEPKNFNFGSTVYINKTRWRKTDDTIKICSDRGAPDSEPRDSVAACLSNCVSAKFGFNER